MPHMANDIVPINSKSGPRSRNLPDRSVVFYVGKQRLVFDFSLKVEARLLEPHPAAVLAWPEPVPESEQSLAFPLACVPEASDEWDAQRASAPGAQGSKHMETSFSITSQGGIRIAEPDDTPVPGRASFASETGLSHLTKDWPLRKLAELWNSLPGVQSVQRFENRKIAVARIWRALQPDAEKPQRSQSKPAPASLPRENTKAASVIALLQRPEGATVHEIMAVTQWQAHSVRGFISGNLVKKRKLKVRSSKRDGQHAYRIR